MADDLADLLEQRRAIDRVLQEKHAADMAVLFTDIVGSTAYFEQRGDVEGLALVHRHNDLLFPLVDAHGGRKVKTIGDAIMAVYPSAAQATSSAQAMMRALVDEAKATSREPIHIRIGIHWGSVLKDGDDVFGDTVNVAARVNSAAAPDEILVSRATAAACGAAVPVVDRAPVAAKGKNAPVDVCAVLWRPDEIDDSATRAAASRLFVLDIAQGPQGLRISGIDGDAARGTVKRHVDVATPPGALVALAEEIALLAHDGGQAAYRADLQKKGEALSAHVLPAPVLDQLQHTDHRALRLHIDDSVVRVPFELARVDVDGQAQWLGCAFAVGRVLSAPDAFGVPKTSATLGRQVVIVADAAGDLEHARKEGELIAGLYRSIGLPDADVVLLSGGSTQAELLAALADCRVLHVAGHVDRTRHGIVVKDGVVDGKQLAAAFAHKVPALVFANACHASTAAPWSTTSLAKALLDAGVRHVLSPMWAVPDRDALAFALRFTEAALAGAPLGEAARRARLALLDDARGALSFAGYVLFGDPRALLPFEGQKLKGAGRTRSAEIVPVAPPETATSTATVTASVTTSTPAWLPRAAVGGGVALAVALAVAALLRPTPDVPAPPSTTATTGTSTTSTTAPSTTVTTAPPPKREGPVRLSVLPFQGGTSAALSEGLTESLVTGLAGTPGITLIERGQINVDIAEIDFQHSKYVDPETRARLGKINGAEVVLLGATVLAADQVRLTARYVDVESGEVLFAVKVDGAADDVFGLQDRLTETVKQSLPDLKKRVRP